MNLNAPRMSDPISKELFARACKVIPGGVNSPVRAFRAVGGEPIFIKEAHGRGLRVIDDIVPNHSSSEHPSVAEAVAAGPGSPARTRFHFRPGRGAHGDEPPNNWLSLFTGPAWTRATEADGSPGEWYLNMFDSTQIDLNWTHPDVRADFIETLRFWLDLGADGFRVDVAMGLAKDMTYADAIDPEAVGLARLGLAELQLAAGQGEIAAAMVEAILKEDVPAGVRARSWLLRGERALQQGDAEAALEAFLRIPVLHASREGLLAPALEGSRRAYLLWDDPARADRAAEELRRTFPDSPEAARLAARPNDLPSPL